MASYNLNYRTYNQLLAEIESDFRGYHLEDMIDPQQFIKVAKRCNYELGLKIFKTKEVVLDVEKGKAKLPNDFYIINFALVLGNFSVTSPVISGTHVEQVPLGPLYNGGTDTIDICATPVVNPEPPCVPCNECGEPEPSCGCTQTCTATLNCKGQSMMLVQKFQFETRKWTEFYSIRIIDNPEFVDADCPNKTWQAKNTAYIKNGFIYPSFTTGKIYINYQGMMEDDDGNLLVPDHDLLNEFYEYAIKQRLLENLIMNGENVNQAQIQIIEQRLRSARNNAYSLVNTPDFNELRKIWETNRKAQYSNYYDMFKSY